MTPDTFVFSTFVFSALAISTKCLATFHGNFSPATITTGAHPPSMAARAVRRISVSP